MLFRHLGPPTDGAGSPALDFTEWILALGLEFQAARSGALGQVASVGRVANGKVNRDTGEAQRVAGGQNLAFGGALDRVERLPHHAKYG